MTGYSERDSTDLQLVHDHLTTAAELISELMDRHRMDLSMQTLTFLAGAKQDADLADREVGMAKKYMQVQDEGTAA